jgi:hypothetical protein
MKDKHGNTVDIGYRFEHEGKHMRVYDIDSDWVVAFEEGRPSVKMKFSTGLLGMSDSNGKSKQQKRKALIEARIKLRSYWED